MIFHHEEPFLLESLNLCLQLQPSDFSIISDLSEPIDVTLHRLAPGQFRLILDSEVISNKTDIVNLQNNVDIDHRTCKDMIPQVLNGLEIMPPVSDLGSLLLQVFPDFDLQSPINQPPGFSPSPGKRPGGHSGVA